MIPPITTPRPGFGYPKPDSPSAQNFKFAESFDIPRGSTDAAGFSYSKSGNGKSNISNRSRPRLTKIRRKLMVASTDVKSVKVDLGLKGFCNPNGGYQLDRKLGNASGGNGGISMSSGSGENGDLNGNKEQVGNASEFGVDSDGSVFGSSVNGWTSNLQYKEADLLPASNNGGSNSDVEKETESFMLGTPKTASNGNQNLSAGSSLFGPAKSGLPLDTKFEGGKFVFGVSDIKAKKSRGFKTQSRANGFKKSESMEFVYGSDKRDSASCVTLNQQDSNNSCSPSSVDEFHKANSAQFVFGVSKNVSAPINSDTQKQDSCEYAGKSESNKGAGNTLPDVRGKVKLDTHLNFVFGSNCNDSNVGIDLDNKPTGKSKDPSNCTGTGKENVDIGIQFRNACLSGVFLFGGSKGKGPFSSIQSTNLVNETNQPNVGKAEDFNGFEQHYRNTPDISSKYRHSSSLGDFSEKGPAVSILDEVMRLNISASEVDSKKTENFTSNFLVNTSSLFVLGNANSKSLGGKRLKKKTGKLKQRTVVQQLFGQDRVYKENNSLQNHKSPGCGSPMDFSPYQDTHSSSAPEADSSNGVKGEFAFNEKDTPEKCEQSDDDENNSNFSPSLPAEDGLSALRRQYMKKYKSKVGSNQTVQGNNSTKEKAKQEAIPTTPHEVCKSWRIRGNQAYHDGKLSVAEELYTSGINFAPHVSTPGYPMKPLLLCYSNRAATRMSLGRMREAIEDCAKAAELDPNFLKVTLRAGNCYLVLGEVEDAIQCYSKCLNSGADVCLDRRITIEASDGLQKAKKVAEYMHQSANLLQEGTDNYATTALKNIEGALSISRFSERLLQMKGEALCCLRMYDEVIELCEQTLDISKKNFGNVKLWRWHIQAKSQFHMGRLELALDLIEKQENMATGSRPGDVTQESWIALAATIRELLSLRKSGNEAFNSGRYAEAIENYTSAISKSLESRPFMAICFCNRAAAYQSINQIVDAIADCSLAIALDENYQKAISRRATLHEMIRDYKHAVYDLQRLISLLESQSRTRTQQSDVRSKSTGGSVRDLRKAHRRLCSVEDKAKKEIPMDLYLILGMKASDAESEIKKAYRKAALKHHPDKVLVRSDVGDCGTLWKDFGEKIHNDADRLFKIIGEAYAVLSDPSKIDQNTTMKRRYGKFTGRATETVILDLHPLRTVLRTKEEIILEDKPPVLVRGLRKTIGGIGTNQDGRNQANVHTCETCKTLKVVYSSRQIIRIILYNGT
ncbi:hypothetical protein OROHE_026567 [Orobanche hederae]